MIVISYRRADTGMIVGRIFEQLEAHFGKGAVFMDIENIPAGIDFRQHIEAILGKCDIVLALIGPHWANVDEHGQSRILDPGDWVRIEIETALKKNVPVIPVLIDHTPHPKPEQLPDTLKALAFRQATDVAAGRDFHVHMRRLIRAMDHLLGRRPRWVKQAMAGTAAIFLIAFGMLYFFRDQLFGLSEEEAIRRCNVTLDLPCVKAGGVFGLAETRIRAKSCRKAEIVAADNPILLWKDIWTTSVFSYQPGGGGPGGGLDNDELRVGGWGDLYYSLIQFKLPALYARPKFSAIILYAKETEGASVPLALDRLIAAWDFPKGGTLWWKDKPGQRAVSSDFLPAPRKGQWYMIDLTELVYEWIDQKSTANYGIQIRPIQSFGSFVFFVSSDATDKSKIPRLIFCF